MRKLCFGAALSALLLVIACGEDNAPDLLVVHFDGGVDSAVPFDAQAPNDGSTVDPELGGPCTADDQCNDNVACTSDACDLSVGRCRFTPDDSLCDDGVYCNGKEVCNQTGCGPGAVVTCEDDDPCTIDSCVESTKSCTHVVRDADFDGDPDGHCTGGHDCDDQNPLVSSKADEICGNGIDDNCNGQVDETPCSLPAADTCATALVVTAGGSYTLSTVATKKDYSESCSVTNPSAGRDVVVAITAPGTVGGPASDIDVWASSESTQIALSLEATCGASGSEVECVTADAGDENRARARSVAAGTTVYAIVTSQAEASIDVDVDFLAPSTKPLNENCSAPQAIATNVATPFTIVDAAKDLSSECDTGDSGTGDLTYSFTLTAASDVNVFAETDNGDGTAVVSLRAADCTDEVTCREGNTPPLYARNLAAGTYVLSVAATESIDGTLLVQTSAPTTAPANQSCATAPAAPSNAEVTVSLANDSSTIENDCEPGAPNAAYDLELTVASDVLIVARFPEGDVGAVSLNNPGCTHSDLLSCSFGGTPQRISKRNLAAGSYRIVIANQVGDDSSLMVLTRPTVVATSVTGNDNCTSTPVSISASGGFYTGDTSKAKADFDAGCDVAGVATYGAPDQIMELVLATPQHVVFDMSGSVYTTILDIRQGLTCPGTEVDNACYVGFSANRSFLDEELAAGTYWVQIDGYDLDAGAWNLDVRVLPP